ncbi:MAG: FAD-dependent oxidoreductase [Bacillota bacterium]
MANPVVKHPGDPLYYVVPNVLSGEGECEGGSTRHCDEVESVNGGNSYSIPYRAPIPAALDGILVAGRCISTTHEAHSSTRVMPTCFATGQAAGTAAALAVLHDLEPRLVRLTLLRSVLSDQGANV